MKVISITSRITAILIIIIGIIHCAFTPSILKEIPVEIHQAFTFIFLLAGIAIIYMGVVLLYELHFYGSGSKSLTMIIGTLGLITITGIGGSYFMPDNPFAWAILAIGILSLSLVLGAHFYQNKQIQTTP